MLDDVQVGQIFLAEDHAQDCQPQCEYGLFVVTLKRRGLSKHFRGVVEELVAIIIQFLWDKAVHAVIEVGYLGRHYFDEPIGTQHDIPGSQSQMRDL